VHCCVITAQSDLYPLPQPESNLKSFSESYEDLPAAPLPRLVAPLGRFTDHFKLESLSVPVPERLFYTAEMTVDLVTLQREEVYLPVNSVSASVNDTGYIAEATTCRSWKQRHVGWFFF
jgi:hypothetical protein